MQGPAELQGLLSFLDLRAKPEDDKRNKHPKMTGESEYPGQAKR